MKAADTTFITRIWQHLQGWLCNICCRLLQHMIAYLREMALEGHAFDHHAWRVMTSTYACIQNSSQIVCRQSDGFIITKLCLMIIKQFADALHFWWRWLGGQPEPK